MSIFDWKNPTYHIVSNSKNKMNNSIQNRKVIWKFFTFQLVLLILNSNNTNLKKTEFWNINFFKHPKRAFLLKNANQQSFLDKLTTSRCYYDLVESTWSDRDNFHVWMGFDSNSWYIIVSQWKNSLNIFREIEKSAHLRDFEFLGNF